MYTGEINEFINWSSGVNELTGDLFVSPDNLISGKSIRLLIQRKLMQPFIVINDTKNGYYRLFSSQEAYNKWIENPEFKIPGTNNGLELFKFTKPSDYSLSYSGVINGENRYILKGETSDVTKILFDWEVFILKNGEKQVIPNEKLEVEFKVTNLSTGKVYTIPKSYDNSLTSIEPIDFAPYLTLGSNKLEATLVGVNTGATNGFIVNFSIVDLVIENNFEYFSENYIYDSTSLLTNFINTGRTVVRRSNPGSNVVVNYHISKLPLNENSVTFTKTTDVLSINIPGGLSTEETVENQLINFGDIITEKGKYVLWIEATSIDANNRPFYSNIECYEFFVRTKFDLNNYYILLKSSFPSNIRPLLEIKLTANQYLKYSLNWSYYSEILGDLLKKKLEWKLKKGNDIYFILSIEAIPLQNNILEFSPIIYTENNDTSLLITDNVNNIIREIPITINKSSFIISKVGNSYLDLTAQGKINSTNIETNKEWKNSGLSGDINIEYSDSITWDDSSGWYNDSLRLYGEDLTVIIGRKLGQSNLGVFNVFGTIGSGADSTADSGRTIEIDFIPERVHSSEDILVLMGTESARLVIRPTKAELYSLDGKVKIYTNYKSNERIKLGFVINPNSGTSVSKGLLFISNNGILERAAIGTENSSFNNSNSPIIIGGSKSGIRIFSIRVYNKALSYSDLYNNFIYDSEDKLTYVTRNDILVDSLISYDACRKKLDTILITGNVPSLIGANIGKNTSIYVDIERSCPTDPTRNFKAYGVRLRKHGQSTLNYPVPSFKFWLNKGLNDKIVPEFDWLLKDSEGLGKNRYKMKENSIPANKFVLQANYADSSGCHNGSLLRLINDTWYNAVINGRHVLRTDPQLFSSGETVVLLDNTEIGKCNVYIKDPKTGLETSELKVDGTWKNIIGNSVNYFDTTPIRTAPDSFPCVIFYKLSDTGKEIFLGLYVFMEDKKSDFCFGERSIYNISNDPFCLKSINADNDTESNKVWDNSNVLRIEGVEIDKPFASFWNSVDELGRGFNDVIQTVIDKQTINLIGWEQDFELIYPDPDDIQEKLDKLNSKSGRNIKYYDQGSEFRKITLPWVNFFNWVISTKNNLTKFKQEAPYHLDLYKMAAYYVFYIRFGLVDSVERNAQYKTYDGQHWHLEPWDMDIALGNRNNGGIAFNPPIDRTTKLSETTWAYSGRSYKNRGSFSSNWLWDALELWDEWMDMVKEISQALYDKGLSYDKAIKMFDEEYQNKWGEYMYNFSGYFKYVESGRFGLNWLLGARTSHRHWWLATSMDYYDSKWLVGDFKNNQIYIATDSATYGFIKIRPNAETFFLVIATSDDSSSSLATYYKSYSDENRITETQNAAGINSPAYYYINTSLTTKTPLHIYGATFIEDLDLRDFGKGITVMTLGGSYSPVLGAPLKNLLLGSKLTPISESPYEYECYTVITNLIETKPSINSDKTTNSGDESTSYDALENIVTLDVRGLDSNVYNPRETGTNRTILQNFYAEGSNYTSFSSSESGNKYNELKLPGINKKSNGKIVSLFVILNLHNSSWNTLEFWNSDITGNTAKLYKVDAPSSLKNVSFTGSTASSNKAKEFIFNWINVLEENEISLKNCEVKLEGINWDGVSYKLLEKLAQFNNGNNQNKNFTGRIILNKEGLFTVNELSKIKEWFGNDVFTANSAGLIISQYLEEGEVYDLISFGGDIKMSLEAPFEGAIKSEDDDVYYYIYEGGIASLEVTRFPVVEKLSTTGMSWLLSRYSNGEGGTSILNSATIPPASSTGGRYLLHTTLGSFGNYSCYVIYQNDLQDENLENSIIKVVRPINIIGSTYPNSWTMTNIMDNGFYNDRFIPLENDDKALLLYNSMYIEIYPLSDILPYDLNTNPNGYNATLSNVNIKITRASDLTVLVNNDLLYIYNNSILFEDDYLKIPSHQISDDPTINETKNRLGIKINCFNLDDIQRRYDLLYTIRWASGKTEVLNVPIIIWMDEFAILTNDGGNSPLYLAVFQAYLGQYGTLLTLIYKSHLLSLSGEINLALLGENLTSLKTNSIQNTRYSILKYLPNVTSIILDNSSITGLDEEIEGSEIDLNNTKALFTLSMLNCPSLSGQLDLSDAYNKSITIRISNPGILTKIKIPNLTYFNITDNKTENLSILSACATGNVFNSSYPSRIKITQNLNAYESVNSSVINSIYDAITRSTLLSSNTNIRTAIACEDDTINYRKFIKVSEFLGGRYTYTVYPTIDEFLIKVPYNQRHTIHTIPCGDFKNTAGEDTISTNLLAGATKFSITSDMCTKPRSNLNYYLFDVSNRLINFGNITLLDLILNNDQHAPIVATQACFTTDQIDSFWNSVFNNDDVYDAVLLYMPKIVNLRFNVWGKLNLTTFGMRINVLYLGSSISTIYPNPAVKVNSLIINKTTVPDIYGYSSVNPGMLYHVKSIYVPANAVSTYKTAWPNCANIIYSFNNLSMKKATYEEWKISRRFNWNIPVAEFMV